MSSLSEIFSPSQKDVLPQKDIPSQKDVLPQKDVPSQKVVFPQKDVPSQKVVFPQKVIPTQKDVLSLGDILSLSERCPLACTISDNSKFLILNS